MRDIVEFFAADFFQLFAALLQFFVDLDGFLRHPVVRLLGAPDEREIVAGRDALVTVGIQSDAENHGFAFFLLRRVGHQFSVKLAATSVKFWGKTILGSIMPARS